MEELATKYPSYITPIVIGKSHEGRDTKGVKLNIGGGDKKIVVLEGTFHAREWISAATTTWILNELLTSSDPDVQAVAKDYEWHIVPVSNPDGYEYTWTTDRNWRKNRRRQNVLCTGVDLNRNWDNHHLEGGASTSELCNIPRQYEY
jgi:murein tripeptide amidase MpaA